MEKKQIKTGVEEEEEDEEEFSSSSESEEEDEEEEEEEEQDDTEALMRELEKIKKEREIERLEKARNALINQERQRLEKYENDRESSILKSNPLINQDFTVKRRWDEDVIFRNTAREEDKPKRRFVNDMLRSDFHRKFMEKYVK